MVGGLVEGLKRRIRREHPALKREDVVIWSRRLDDPGRLQPVALSLKQIIAFDVAPHFTPDWKGYPAGLAVISRRQHHPEEFRRRGGYTPIPGTEAARLVELAHT
jgi:hypothetical protein